MFAQNYKKMAGTSAVFLSSEYDGASPVERDGMLWSAKELHLDEPLEQRLEKRRCTTLWLWKAWKIMSHPRMGT